MQQQNIVNSLNEAVEFPNENILVDAITSPSADNLSLSNINIEVLRPSDRARANDLESPLNQNISSCGE